MFSCQYRLQLSYMGLCDVRMDELKENSECPFQRPTHACRTKHKGNCCQNQQCIHSLALPIERALVIKVLITVLILSLFLVHLIIIVIVDVARNLSRERVTNHRNQAETQPVKRISSVLGVELALLAVSVR